MQNPVDHGTLSIACHVQLHGGVSIHSNLPGLADPQVKWEGLSVFNERF